MYRTLTAAVALTAALGMAGLAHAQSSAGPSTQPNTMAPSTPSTNMNAPSTGPTGTQNPASRGIPAGSNSSTSGMQSPQASTQPPGQMNQASQPASQSQIEQAQQQLKSAGLYRGQVDGVMGPETQTALMSFQREHGLPQSAQLDQQTMSRLMSGQSGSTGSGPTGSGSTGNGAVGMQNGSTGTSMQPSTSSSPSQSPTGGSYNR